jgi:precorrin-6B methylase 1
MISIEDIIKEARLKGKEPLQVVNDESEPAKLASQLEALASDADSEAQVYAQLTEEKNEKLASIKVFVDTLNEVL